MTTTTELRSTEIPCPSWCTVDHADMPGAGAHGGSVPVAFSTPVRLRQHDSEVSSPRVLVLGQLLSEAEAHELGMALVRAADVLRREAQR